MLSALLLLPSCADREPPAEETTPSAVMPPDPDSMAIERIRAQLPPGTLRRSNGCPFECCVYREWTAATDIPLRAAPNDSSTITARLRAGEQMNADSGIVFVTGLAIAIVDDTVFRGAERRPWLLPNDTLVLLDPIGEGHWNAWRRGEVLEDVPPFFEGILEPRRGRLIGDPTREWWAFATAGNRRGWFRPDQFRVSGADACG